MKRVLTILLCFVLCSFLVGAMELNPFGIAKEYKKDRMEVNNLLKEKFNEKYGVIELWDTSFWFKSNKLAEYSLTKNDEQCLINCEAEGEAILYREEKLFDNVLFKTEKNKNVNIEYKYFIKDKEEYEEDTPIYEEICSEEYNVKNKTIEERCRFEIKEIKTEKKVKEIWKEYNGEVLPAGKYEWKIKGKKKPFSNIDFIPVKKNKEFSEWAWWNSSWYKKIEINVSSFYLIYNISFIDGMNSDFSDLRFVDENEEEELPYYTEIIFHNSSAIFRVKTNGNKKIYMYFNNPYVSSNSNITEVYNGIISAVFFSNYSGNNAIDSANVTRIWNNIGGGYTETSGVFYGGAYVSSGASFNSSSGALPPKNNKFSFSLWYKANFTNNNNVFVNNPSSGDFTQLVFYNNYYWIYHSSGWNTGESAHTGIWTQVTYTYDGNNEKIYENGVLKSSRTYGGIFGTSGGIATLSNPAFSYSGEIAEFMFFDKDLNQTEVYNIYNSSKNAFFGSQTAVSPIQLIKPTNYYKTNSSNVVFNCSVIANEEVNNLSLIINNLVNYTLDGEGTSYLSLEKELNLTEGNHIWRCEAYIGGINYSSQERNLDVDKTAPLINLYNNESIILSESLPYNLKINISFSDNISGINKTLYSFNDIEYYNFNLSNPYITIDTTGINNLYFLAEDNAGNINKINYSFTLLSLNISEIYTKKKVYFETETEEYFINISFEQNKLGETKAFLIYNNISINTTKREGEIGKYSFLYIFDAPTQDENLKQNEVFIKFLINTSTGWVEYNTSKIYVNTTRLIMGLCNSSLTNKILNISTQDEKTKNYLNFYIKSNYIYYLGNKEAYKNYSLTNLSLNPYFMLCVNNNSFNEININSEIEIGANSSYNIRKYNIEGKYNNHTNNITLYLLDVYSSAPFTISFFNGIDTFANKYINILKYDYSIGQYFLISTKKTDTSGRIMEYLDLDNKYLFVSEMGAIEKNSVCDSTPCTLTINFAEGSSYLFKKIDESWAFNISSNLSYDYKENKVKYLFLDLEGKATYFRLLVNGIKNKQESGAICDKTYYGFVGVLECDMTNYTGDFRAYGYVSKSPEKLDKSLSFVLDEQILKNKQRIVFFFFLISLFIIGGLIISGGSPFIPLLVFALSLLVTKIIRLNPYSWFVNVSLIMIIIIILWRLEKN